MIVISSQITDTSMLCALYYGPFLSGVYRWQVESPHYGPVTQMCSHVMTSYHNMNVIDTSRGGGGGGLYVEVI